jgi:hypothetical protein
MQKLRLLKQYKDIFLAHVLGEVPLTSMMDLAGTLNTTLTTSNLLM